MQTEEALRFLDQHINRRLTRDNIDDSSLETMRSLLHVLGDPQLDFPVVHITGTNGKGSTSAIASNLLASMGLKVGTYSSPHVSSITERIQIDTEPIAEEEFNELVSHLSLVEPSLQATPSWFELMTAAAFRSFADNAIDVAVIEVGMLGRFDATNIADADVAVITNVGFDHTDGSENWRRKLAWEKAGIIKKNKPIVISEFQAQIHEIFVNKANALNSDLYLALVIVPAVCEFLFAYRPDRPRGIQIRFVHRPDALPTRCATCVATKNRTRLMFASIMHVYAW